MNVIESFLKGKISQEQCEDGLYIGENFISVVDGVTSQSEFYGGAKGGKIVKDLIIEALPQVDYNATMEEAMSFLNKRIETFYKEKGFYEQLKNNTEQKISACIIIYSKARNQLWFLGDSQVLIDDKYYCFEAVGSDYFSNLRSYLITAEILSGRKTEAELLEHDTIREAIYPLMTKEKIFQNNENAGKYSSSVLNGFKFVKKDLHCVNVPKLAKQIVIASDGYPFLEPTLKESEAKLSALLEEDPLLYKKFKSTKGIKKGNCSFDDRTYVRFTL